MQRWPSYLADAPATLLRLIAATSRVSLPRRSSPELRLARVRAAICRPAAVRSSYFALAPGDQAAAQALRSTPRCLAPELVEELLGPLRPLAELRHDRAPRTTAERFLLLGWLLPRPASRNHPAHFVVPPELRDWLPRPLALATAPGAGPAGLTSLAPPALRAATAILVAAALRPLPLRRDGGLSVEACRRLHPLLSDLDAAEGETLTRWITPLLLDLGLLAPDGAAAAIAPAAARFLAASPEERLHLLRAAWERAPRAEPALLPPRASQGGLDWPGLRRRLAAWAEALATSDPTDDAGAFDRLTAAFGPLADGYTHPFRSCTRPPWNRATAIAVWERARRGPLAWLGLARPPGPGGILAAAQPPEPPATPWSYGSPGCFRIAPADPGAELLDVAPFAAGLAGDGEALTITLSAASVGRAVGRGHDPARLRRALERRAGPPPAPWADVLAPAGELQLLRRTVLLADAPEALRGALKRRAVRRLVEDVLAPGVALAAPGREEALAAQLTRQGHVVCGDTASPPATPPPAELSSAEVAALLVAGAHYRAEAPSGAPPGPSDPLMERLRAGLSPALAAATDAAIASLRPSRRSEDRAPEPAGCVEPAPPLVEMLWRLRDAIRRRDAVALWYQGADEQSARERTVRPIALERHGSLWYLSAYCLGARAERCFRLDRIHGLSLGSVEVGKRRPATGDDTAGAVPAARPGRSSPARRRAPPRTGFFAGPADPPAGSPLVGVWLDGEEAAGRLDERRQTKSDERRKTTDERSALPGLRPSSFDIGRYRCSHGVETNDQR